MEPNLRLIHTTNEAGRDRHGVRHGASHDAPRAARPAPRVYRFVPIAAVQSAISWALISPFGARRPSA